MEPEIIQICVFYSEEEFWINMYVEQLGEHLFRATENELFDFRLTIGTEFETCLNEKGEHEIVRITRESEYSIRRFLLSQSFGEAELQMLGEEVVKHGGHWQIDMGGIATINLPPGCSLNIDEVFKLYKIYPTEFVE